MSVIEIAETQCFPSVINVRCGAKLRRYTTERTCRVERVSTPYHAGPPRCSACMMPIGAFS